MCGVVEVVRRRVVVSTWEGGRGVRGFGFYFEEVAASVSTQVFINGFEVTKVELGYCRLSL